MRRIVLLPPLFALALLVSLAPGFTRQARAYETWCFDDPVIIVGGQLIDIRVSMPLSKLLAMRSTTLTVVIPRNVSGGVVLDDVSVFPMTTVVSPTGPSWNGRGKLPITVTASVNASTSYPIKVTATPLIGLGVPLLGLLSPLTGTTSASGMANTPIVMGMALAR